MRVLPQPGKILLAFDRIQWFIISYEGELDIYNKWNNFFKITDILNNVFRPQKKPLKRIALYNTLALPVLLYGSETWTIKASDARRITAAEMKYVRRTAG